MKKLCNEICKYINKICNYIYKKRFGILSFVFILFIIITITLLLFEGRTIYAVLLILSYILGWTACAHRYHINYDWISSTKSKYIDKHATFKDIDNDIICISPTKFFKFIRDVIFGNFISIILITSIMYIINILFFHFGFYKNDSGVGFWPPTAAQMIIFISIIITLIGSYYSYVAERNAKSASDHSSQLVEEKSQFLDGFDGFLGRIVSRIGTGEYGIQTQHARYSNEKNPFYFIKCIFLTPFPGHAGVVESNKKYIYQAKYYQQFQTHLIKLISDIFHKCKVQMICPPPKTIYDWYYYIFFIEYYKKSLSDKHLLSMKKTHPTTFLKKIHDQCVFNLNKYKLNGPMFLSVENYKVEIESYKSRLDNYRDLISSNQNFFEIRSLQNSIPYQLFIISKPKPKKEYNSMLFPSDDNCENDEKTGRRIEDPVCAILSFVGEDTYYNVYKNLKKHIISNDKNASLEGGVDTLLNELHSCFYTENPRLINILNNHFSHMWDSSIKNDIFNFKDVQNEKKALNYFKKKL